jgi:hypothetical protein
MLEGKWTPFEDTHPTINPEDLEKKKQHKDYEIEAEVATEKEKDSDFKKLNFDLSHIFKNHKN